MTAPDVAAQVAVVAEAICRGGAEVACIGWDDATEGGCSRCEVHAEYVVDALLASGLVVPTAEDLWDYDRHPGDCCTRREGDVWTTCCCACAGTGVFPVPWIEVPSEGRSDPEACSCVACKGSGRAVVTLASPEPAEDDAPSVGAEAGAGGLTERPPLARLCGMLERTEAQIHEPGGFIDRVVDLEQQVSEQRARADAAEQERDRLAAWKAEALPVISGLQDLGRSLGVPLGRSITGPEAATLAEQLRSERDAAEQTVQRVRDVMGDPTYRLWTIRGRECVPRHEVRRALDGDQVPDGGT